MKQLEFKKYYVGNFYIEKVCRPYQNDFLSKVARSNGYLYKVREVVRKAGYVPFIIVGDNLGMWKSEFAISSNIYHFLDTLKIDDNGKICEEGIKEFLIQMYFFNTVVGDADLLLDKKMVLFYILIIYIFYLLQKLIDIILNRYRHKHIIYQLIVLNNL